MKKLLTVTNFLVLIIVLIYILDRYIVPIPENYKGFTFDATYEESLKEIYGDDFFDHLTSTQKKIVDKSKEINGYIGGRVTNVLAIVGKKYNPKGFAPYRFITVALVHMFLAHIVLNMIALIIIGNYVEKRYGAFRMLFWFFAISALSFVTTNLIWPIVSDVAGGASGGVFGLMGIGLATGLVNHKEFKKISGKGKIFLAFYGLATTYVLSANWTTLIHNVALLYGVVIGCFLCMLNAEKRTKVKEPDQLSKESDLIDVTK